MVTKFITTAFLALLYCQMMVYSQPVQNDLEKQNLKGKVKSIEETETSFPAYGWGSGSTGKTSLQFNINGNLINSTKINNAIGFEKETFTYDTKGWLILIIRKNSIGKVESKIIFKNDPKGNVIQRSNYDGSARVSEIIIYKRNSQGIVIEELTKYPPKTDWDKTSFRYDEKGTLIEENNTIIANKKKFESKRIFAPTYNDKGLIEQVAEYYNPPLKNPDDIVSFKYNEVNKIISKHVSDTDILGNPYHRISTWDDKGNLIKYERGRNLDNLETTSYNYEFDAAGNWIKKSALEKEKVIITTERVISYY